MRSLAEIEIKNAEAVRLAAQRALAEGNMTKYATIVKANPDLFVRRAR